MTWGHCKLSNSGASPQDFRYAVKIHAYNEIQELKESKNLEIPQGTEENILKKSINLKSLNKQTQFLQEIARISKTTNIIKNQKLLESIFLKINNDIQGFQLWFDHSLNDEDRMLVIGLSAFYGMGAEQTFSILDRVVDEVWRPRRANLPYYDYKDIQKISTHFEVVSNNLEVKDERFPDTVFKYCWENHRRLLTTLLPIAIKVAKESFSSNKKTNRELFGTKIKKQKVRSVISLFLGRIFLLEPRLAEEYILDLITFQNDGAVSIAAHAISYIYHENDVTGKNEIKLLLKSWLDQKTIIHKNTIKLLKEELDDKEDTQQPSAKAEGFSAGRRGLNVHPYCFPRF